MTNSRRHSKRSASWSRLLSVTVLVTLILTVTSSVAQTQFPSIDFEGLGNVGIAGSFDGIAIWKPSLATNNDSNVYNSNTSSLILRDANGMLSKINQTNEGGRIEAVCQMSKAPNTVYVGGLFSEIAGLNVSNIAAYDPTSKAWNALNGGLNGEVLSLYCDDTHNVVYAGGSFVSPANITVRTRYLGGVANWNLTSKAWAPAPFGGVNGSVSQISQGVNASTLRFAGAFTTDFSSSIGTNSSISGTNSSASPLSIGYAPLSLGQSEFQGGPSSSNADYSNPAQILCPQGNDGPGNTYLFADNAPGRLTMRTFRNLPTKAIRLGNTFIDGRGTKTFGVISIPDNTQLELLYLDPVTKQNVTCTTDCPLAHDAAIPYQDFLISDNPSNGLDNGVKALTGIQLTVNTWYGAGAGLHLLQLLSDGNIAYAYPAYNRATCSSSVTGASGNRASTRNTGAWYYSTVRSSSTNTMEPLLALSDFYSNLGNNLDARVTWTLDVPYDGNYTASLFVPGCQDGDQCNVRTDVQARMINNASTAASPGSWTRVSQTNPLDASVQIFSGPVQKSSGSFQPRIQLSIPADAPAPSGSDRFSVYADRVSLQLLNSNELNQYYRGQGIGILEYNVYDAAANNNSLAFEANSLLQQNDTASIATLNNILPSLYNGTQTLSNASMTAADYFSVTLASEGVRQNETESVSSIAVVGNVTFVGGTFVSSNLTDLTGFANVVAYDDASGGKSYQRLAGGGLNAPVYSLVEVNNYLFVGGDFTSTADNKTAISFVARYDPKSNTWASLGVGVDGTVRSLSAMGTQLLIVGSFSSVNGTANSGGVAAYDTVGNAWIAQPESVVGTLTGAAVAGDSTFLVGQVESVGSTPASAAIELVAPSVQGQYPNITAYNIRFPDSASRARAVPNGAQAAAPAKRHLSAMDSLASDLVYETRSSLSLLGGASIVSKRSSSGGNLFNRLAARATGVLQDRDTNNEKSSELGSLYKRADVMDPPSLNTNGAYEIYSTAFWQRNSSSYVTVLGGNFTTSNGVTNLGIYEPSTKSLVALPAYPAGTNLTVVRSVYVDKDTLYVGGDGGVLSFDLDQAQWINLPALTAQSGTVLSVRAIGHRPNSNTMIVAGTFSSAGGLPCKNVCEWDSKMLRWISVGNGVDGNIAALDFAGPKANTLILAGSLNIDGREVALASWQFDTNSAAWVALGAVGGGSGQAPGPATAVSVDNLNADAIFVAGRSDAGTYAYLSRWDGTKFSAVGQDELLPETGVAHLSFVGLTSPHAENAVLESNRMLVVSGAIGLRSYGNVSSALFDGQNWTPFVLTTRQGGGSGVVRAFTRSVEVLNFLNLHRLAVGIVILISIAIGLGLVFLLVLLGLIWALLFRRRRNHPGVAVPAHTSEETLAGGMSGDKAVKRRPSSLLATLNKATENVIGGSHAADGRAYADVTPGTATAAAVGAAGIAGVGAAAASSSHDHTASSYGHGMGTVSHGDESGAVLSSSQHHSNETGGPGGGGGAAQHSSNYHSDGQTGQSGVSRYYSGDEGVPALAAGIRSSHDDAAQADAEGIEAHARYTFEATHASELGVHAGEKIWVLDDQDEHWWLARNAEGRTGVLPASYVL